ncbi:MAG: recombinase RecA [Planctomycetota bacterium]
MAGKKKETPSNVKNHNPHSEDLNRAVGAIEKMFGKGAIMVLGKAAQTAPVPCIPTGSLGLDLALGTGGMPKGRICEIFGPESSGKTTLCLHLVANAQKAGGSVAFIDAEHALDPMYAKKLGVDLDSLLVSQPDSGEQALEICEMLVKSGAVDLVVVDSVAALVPTAELEGEMGQSHVGLQARLMSQALRKLTSVAHKSETAIIFINQIREKIGVMFGSPETTPGGRALKFYSSVRLDIRRLNSIKKGEAVIGSRTRVKVVKNKMAAPFKMAEFDIIYNQGINYLGEIIDAATELSLIDKSGSWYMMGSTKLGQGREQAMESLAQNPTLVEELRRKIFEQRSGASIAESGSDDGSEQQAEAAA